MTPSPYFTDTFRYFFKRFYSSAKLFKWFLKQAGEAKDLERANKFMRAMPDAWFKNMLFCTHESQHSLISSRRSHAVYYSDKECRFGEPVFNEIQRKIQEFAPQVCLYLDDPFLPRLFLAKTSGAPCRIGFATENYYPFLNLSLHPEQSSEAELIARYYGVTK